MTRNLKPRNATTKHTSIIDVIAPGIVLNVLQSIMIHVFAYLSPLNVRENCCPYRSTDLIASPTSHLDLFLFFFSVWLISLLLELIF